MKTLNLYFLSLLIMFLLSCASDKSDYYDTIETASVTATSGAGFIDLLNIDSETVSINFEQDGGSSIKNVSVSASYGKDGNLVALQNISGNSGNFSISVVELLQKLQKSESDVKVGDNIIFFFDLTDGNDYVSRDRNTLVLPFSCPSDLAGEYTSLTTGASTDGCCPTPEVDFPSEVTLTRLSDGRYQISDFSAGLYLKWYGPDGGDYGISSNEQSPGKIQNICGVISFFDTTEPFATAVTGSGSVDQATGKITYTWKNGYDDTGTVVLTKK